jgi:hypothetical protein
MRPSPWTEAIGRRPSAAVAASPTTVRFPRRSETCPSGQVARTDRSKSACASRQGRPRGTRASCSLASRNLACGAAGVWWPIRSSKPEADDYRSVGSNSTPSAPHYAIRLSDGFLRCGGERWGVAGNSARDRLRPLEAGVQWRISGAFGRMRCFRRNAASGAAEEEDDAATPNRRGGLGHAYRETRNRRPRGVAAGIRVALRAVLCASESQRTA